MPRAVLLLLALLPTVSCGYLKAGQWDDDPDNWKRAFRSRKPADVVVLHSRYERSPHFTYEFLYFFEIRANEALQRQLFTENNLHRLQAPEVAILGGKPDWFAPKPLDSYDIWGFADEPTRNFRVLIDRSSGNIFLADYQF